MCLCKLNGLGFIDRIILPKGDFSFIISRMPHKTFFYIRLVLSLPSNLQNFGATRMTLSLLPPITTPYIIRIEGEEDLQYYQLGNLEETPLLDWIRQRTLPLLPEVSE